MSDDQAARKFFISIAIKILIVVVIGTAVAFWYLSEL